MEVKKISVNEEKSPLSKVTIYNEELQGEVNKLRDKMRGIEKRNAIGAVIRSRVQWK